MFHKRLLQEFKDLKFKVLGMVAAQWSILVANIIMMSALSLFLQKMMNGNAGHREAGIYTGIVLAAIILRFVMTKWNARISAEASSVVKTRMRSKIFNKLAVLSTGYREQMKTSEVVQFTTEGVEQLEIYFGKYVPQFFYSMIAPLTLFIITASISIKIAVVLLVCVPLIPVSIILVQKFARKMLAKYWGTYTEMGDSFLECLQGLTTLKIYNADQYYADEMDEEAETFRKVTMKVLIMQLNSISIMDLVAYGGAGIGIVLSIIELNAGNITFAQGFFLIMIAAEYFLPMRLLGSFFHIAMNGNAAADKIFALLDQKNPVDEGTEENADMQTILMKDVCFSYHGNKQILDHVSMKLSKGITALAGVSGCGKSTVTSLIMKNSKLGGGEILVDGISLTGLKRKEVHKNIVKIGHDSYIFAGTIRSNLLMGKADATDEELFKALEKVNMLSFVQNNGGLDYSVLEKGSNLSGGQRQRIAVARALLYDARVYIFDEATSNVDADSEDDIMNTVRQLSKYKIVLLISHRLANVVDADEIYVLNHGIIAEHGKHDELMDNTEGIYHELFMQQKQLEDYGKVGMLYE